MISVATYIDGDNKSGTLGSTCATKLLDLFAAIDHAIAAGHEIVEKSSTSIVTKGGVGEFYLWKDES